MTEEIPTTVVDPKCGIGYQEVLMDGVEAWSCGTVSQMFRNSYTDDGWRLGRKCLRNQLATVTAERDAARAELKGQLGDRYIACEPEIYI